MDAPANHSPQCVHGVTVGTYCEKCDVGASLAKLVESLQPRSAVSFVREVEVQVEGEAAPRVVPWLIHLQSEEHPEKNAALTADTLAEVLELERTQRQQAKH